MPSNNLAQSSSSDSQQSQSNLGNGPHAPPIGLGPDENENLSKLKRTACIICRKRKLKCDGGRPKCQTCNRLGHDCKYDEVRKKSGPKRGYVKVLEARLAQVETQLKHSNNASEDPAANTEMPNPPALEYRPSFAAYRQPEPAADIPTDFSGFGESIDYFGTEDFDPQRNPTLGQSQEPLMSFEEPLSWDLISLGLEEPLPTYEVMSELTEIYFDMVHPSMPLLHRARFLANMHLAPSMRPPVCLRYAMWTLAAALNDQYLELVEHFYRRARKYLEIDEMRGFGESMITLAHCQTWVLLAVYEFKNMHFPRAWMSTGRAVRMAQMLSLHRLDGAGLDVKQCLPPPKDWTEREERRRTFWMVFWADRCASIGTGWPMTVDEQDIMTKLPSTEEAYQSCKPEPTSTLAEAMEGRSSNNFSGFAGALVLSAIFGRNLTHLHRPGPDDREDDLNGGFWERHRKLDNIILNINLNLPSNLRIPMGLPDPNIIFMNMCIHTSIICLHQAAIFKADKHQLPANVSGESKMRCLTAASEIAGIMRSIAHMDLAVMNPFMAFCLYVSARVFVQVLKARRNDQQMKNSLDFLLRAMHILKRKNALTESFIAQLDLDMESAGLPNPNYDGSLDSIIKKGIPIYPRSAQNIQNHFPEGATDVYLKGQITELKSGALSDQNRKAATNLCSSDMVQGFSSFGPIPTNLQAQQVRTESSASSERSLPTNHQRPHAQSRQRPSRWEEGALSSSLGLFEAAPDGRESGGDWLPSNGVLDESAMRDGDIDMSPQTIDNGSSRQNSVQQGDSWLACALPAPDLSPNSRSNSSAMPLSKPPSNSTTDTSPSSNSNPAISPAGISEQEFNNITNQLFPPTPGADLDPSMSKVPEGWDWANMSTTPGFSGLNNEDDWRQMLETMTGWETVPPKPNGNGDERWMGR